MIRFISRLAFLALAATVLSCATKKEKPAPGQTASTSKPPLKSGKPTPTPSVTPAPSPTPQVRYTATVRVEGQDPIQQVLSADAQSSPSPQPSPSATPAASPTPAAKSAAAPNFFSRTWQKVFPPKATPTPQPSTSSLGAMSFRVTTGDRSNTPWPQRANSGPAVPTPTPIAFRRPSSENYLSRTWHKFFPKKQVPPSAEPPQWIGTVKLVNDREGYALIDAASSYALPNGETLNAVGNSAESGVLRVTADRNPPFFIADIVSGKPKAGDRVYSPKVGGSN
jgi:hypothetical protein